LRDTFYKILASIIRHILGFFLLVALLIMSACDFIGKLFGKKDTEYKISFKGWYSYDKETERVGITSIGVANETIVSQFKNQYKEELTKYPIRNNSLSDQLDYYNIKWQMCIGDS